MRILRPRAARPAARTLLVGLVAGALTGALVGAVAGQSAASSASSAPQGRDGRDVIVRDVEFTLTNLNETSVPCTADGREYTVTGRLVGPRDEVQGRAGSTRVNVLVHDAGTGGWFWNLTDSPRHDYAGRLAEHGETSLVLDRLGFGGSTLSDGRATCLGAQATMLHQVVQNLRAGIYRFADRPRRSVVHASQVVVHGHGVGAAVAQLEAAEFHDTEGLVVMGWSDLGASPAAVQTAAEQTRVCLDDDYAAYGATPAEFRSLLFASALPSVQRRAVQQRSATPCGDVTSLLGTVGVLSIDTGAIKAPVLLLRGGRDARTRGDDDQAGRYESAESVTAHTFARAGSALPLERQAPQVRRSVLDWLDATLVER